MKERQLFDPAGVLLGILISASAVFSLAYGSAGSKGNSALSGMVLAICLSGTALVLLRRVTLVAQDYIFILFTLSVLCTFALNGMPASANESILLCITLACYLSCRLIDDAAMARACLSLLAVSLIVVALGTGATAKALFEQWARAKPFVLGSDSAPTQLLQTAGLLVLASVTLIRLSLKRAVLISIAAAIPIAIFAASLVGFSFIALFSSLALVAVFSRGAQRRWVLLVGAVLALSVVAGIQAKHVKARVLADYVIEKSAGTVSWERPPSCDLQINVKNSVAIRKALALDAIYLAPASGLFGTGLDSFMKFSCVKLTEVHNSLLQAVVEFGWLGGVLLLGLAGFSMASIVPLAKQGRVPLFLFSSLAFLILISMSHGRLSREFALFAFLGAIGGYVEGRSRQNASGSTKPAFHTMGP